MTKYEFLSHLLTFVVVLALGGMFFSLRVILRSLSPGSVHAWLDRETDTYADYMEDEQERRTALFHGDDDAKSLRRWYGISYLVERRLFVWQYRAAERLSRWQLQPQGEFDGQDWTRL